MSAEFRFIPLPDFHGYPEKEMVARARAFRDDMRRRRTVRHFSDRPVPREVVEACLEAVRRVGGPELRPCRTLSHDSVLLELD